MAGGAPGQWQPCQVPAGGQQDKHRKCGMMQG
jgi:hypothetical protein